MSQKKIKICGMRDLQNIAEISELKPDLLGFIFYENSPRFAGNLDPILLDNISNGPPRVGVFVNSSVDEIKKYAELYGLQIIQLHGDETPEFCQGLAKFGYKTIKAFGIATKEDIVSTKEYEGSCDFFLFDKKSPSRGGTGEKFDHNVLAHYSGNTPYILSGGISAEDTDLIEAISDHRCIGIDINSRFETSAGVKDVQRVKEFMEKLKKEQIMNRIDKLFADKKENILSVYFTAGYPALEDTTTVITELSSHGVDIIEVGIPFSDPMADGVVIQQSGSAAIKNGITLAKIFEQLKDIRQKTEIPLIMMGYLNPIMQYGIENFCRDCVAAGIDGMIIPDLPFADYMKTFKPLLSKYGLYGIMLITPETSEERIKLIDQNTQGFIYMVSTASTTGSKDSFDEKTQDYFKRISKMNLRNPRLIGFGVSNQATFEAALSYASGAIIGSEFIRQLGTQPSVKSAVTGLLKKLGR